MSLADVRRLVTERGVDAAAIAFGEERGVVPAAPSHVWVAFENRAGAILVGGLDRGVFAAYDLFDDDDAAVDALERLAAGRGDAPAPDDLDALRRAAEDGADAVRAAGPGQSASDVPVGTALDHIGNESGHVLYLLDAPMPSRSLPPTDLNEPRTGYVLRAPLPRAVGLAVAPPWFGQPGGALLVSLDRVIAAYVEQGVLEPFSVR